ncbi:hypothetical protein [Neobacillus ginsengisoli]|uniref:Uncharacterized protein n=1 Tax=Neobacillus ginsengisoli TaxID=904295 RepID=A0ABT9Y2I1_9BACI|nr:hypothetical protein [Neobacillus ginsengisoli]
MAQPARKWNRFLRLLEKLVKIAFRGALDVTAKEINEEMKNSGSLRYSK